MFLSGKALLIYKAKRAISALEAATIVAVSIYLLGYMMIIF